MIKVEQTIKERIYQGDIFRDVAYIESVSEVVGVIEIKQIIFPLCIVLTQDCDLEQYNKIQPNSENHDKWLLSVLVAPLYNIEHLRNGTHLEELNLSMQKMKKDGTQYKYLTQNQLPRYHYLDFPEETQIVGSVIDFKHYFSVSVSYLREKKTSDFICSVSELYRENISHRFAYFLSRIGLPDTQET